MVILDLKSLFYISFYIFFFQLSDFPRISEFLIWFSCFRHLVAFVLSLYDSLLFVILLLRINLCVSDSYEKYI